MRLVLSLLLALSMLPSAALAAEDVLDVNPRQRTAAHVGLGFGLGTQAIALGSTLVWAVSGNGTALAISIPADIVNLPMSAAGIAGFEGTLRDGTVAGRLRGLGTGFLEGGIYSLGMGGLLVAGMARREAVDCSAPYGEDDYPPCFEDFTGVIVVPTAVTYFAVGAAYTAIGAALLGAASRNEQAALPKLRIAPTFAGGPDGFRVGIVGRF
jgi:hypothetical protein